MDEIPKLENGDSSVKKTDGSPVSDEHKKEIQEKLEKILNTKQKFDIRKRDYTPIWYSAVITLVVLIIPSENIKEFFMPIIKAGNIPGELIYWLISTALNFIKIGLPLWIAIIFQFFPLGRPSIYQFVIDYQFIETFDLATYESNIKRVRFLHQRVISVRFFEGKTYQYLDLLDEYDKSLGCVRLDYINMDNLKMAVKLYTDKEHPLNKYFS